MAKIVSMLKKSRFHYLVKVEVSYAELHADLDQKLIDDTTNFLEVHYVALHRSLDCEDLVNVYYLCSTTEKYPVPADVVNKYHDLIEFIFP